MKHYGIDSNIHEAARLRLLNECQKLNGCETGECKATLGYNLPVKYVFHAVRRRSKNDHNLNGCYKNYLQVLACNVKSVAFFCRPIGFQNGK